MKIIHSPDTLVKICPKCPMPYLGIAEIVQNFGHDPSRGDKFRVYCKMHINEMQKQRRAK